MWKDIAKIAIVSLVVTALVFRVDAVKRVIVVG